jgi:hypothetical protein
MNIHPRAKLGLAGRRARVAAIEDGTTLKAAAAAFNVAPADCPPLVSATG